MMKSKFRKPKIVFKGVSPDTKIRSIGKIKLEEFAKSSKSLQVRNKAKKLLGNK